MVLEDPIYQRTLQLIRKSKLTSYTTFTTRNSRWWKTISVYTPISGKLIKFLKLLGVDLHYFMADFRIGKFSAISKKTFNRYVIETNLRLHTHAHSKVSGIAELIERSFLLSVKLRERFGNAITAQENLNLRARLNFNVTGVNLKDENLGYSVRLKTRYECFDDVVFLKLVKIVLEHYCGFFAKLFEEFAQKLEF